MAKRRTTVTASALGSYFGVGYNDPLVQLENDMGGEEITFAKAQLDAMEVSSLVENGILDIVEARNNCIVTERNTATEEALGGKLRVRKDGYTTIDGEDYVVEVKHVASGSNFINNLGHHFQVMSQILAEREKGREVNKGILAGLYQGRYYQVFLELTPELEEDIYIMVNTVVAILKGELPIEMYPANIVDKYAPLPAEADQFDDADEDKVEELVKVKQEIKDLKAKETELQDYLKIKYSLLDYESPRGYKITIQEQTRKGGVDLEAIVTDHPEIKLDDYRKPSSTYQVVRTK